MDEYAGEAAALVSTLRIDSTLEQVTHDLNEIWRSKFGRYRNLKDGQFSESYDFPDYKAPDLREAAYKIYEALRHYLHSLHS